MSAHWMSEFIGSLAGFCTTASLVPQLYRIRRTRSAGDLSLAMFVVFGAGIALWLVFGIVVGSPAVIAANGASLLLVMAILWLAARYQRSTIK